MLSFLSPYLRFSPTAAITRSPDHPLAKPDVLHYFFHVPVDPHTACCIHLSLPGLGQHMAGHPRTGRRCATFQSRCHSFSDCCWNTIRVGRLSQSKMAQG